MLNFYEKINDFADEKQERNYNQKKTYVGP